MERLPHARHSLEFKQEAVLFWLAALFALRRMAKADPQLSKVWLRHIKQQLFYAAKTSRWCVTGGKA